MRSASAAFPTHATRAHVSALYVVIPLGGWGTRDEERVDGWWDGRRLAQARAETSWHHGWVGVGGGWLKNAPDPTRVDVMETESKQACK